MAASGDQPAEGQRRRPRGHRWKRLLLFFFRCHLVLSEFSRPVSNSLPRGVQYGAPDHLIGLDLFVEIPAGAYEDSHIWTELSGFHGIAVVDIAGVVADQEGLFAGARTQDQALAIEP